MVSTTASSRLLKSATSSPRATHELPRDVDSAQWLELRVTPEDEMAGELWHAVWSYTSQPVDVRDSRSVVRVD